MWLSQSLDYSTCVSGPARKAGLSTKRCRERGLKRQRTYSGPDPPGVSADLIVKEPPAERQEELVSEGRCKTCGVPQNEIPWGCNQEGRVAGGLGAVVGFEWWPIKAYKPCGKAAKAGVLYTRKGQITDEMLFGSRERK